MPEIQIGGRLIAIDWKCREIGDDDKFTGMRWDSKKERLFHDPTIPVGGNYLTIEEAGKIPTIEEDNKYLDNDGKGNITLKDRPMANVVFEVKDLKLQKKQLEQAINHLIEDFEEQSGFEVIDVFYDRQRSIDGQGVIIERDISIGIV